MEDSEIVKFFRGANVFLTGATGYLGKIFLEKLLRDCWDLNKIFITLRPKKGKDVQQRLEEIFEPIIFDRIREIHPDFLKKVEVLHGDLEKPNLGLSLEDQRKMEAEIDIVIHCAATTRFDEHIRKATMINVCSVKDLLEIAERMKNLRAFIHVSTAFSNSDRSVIDELIYKPVMEADNLLKLIDCLDDEKLEAITPVILNQYPNTYTFTKQIAEYLVWEKRKVLPVGIVRPAIVTSSVREPIPGWVDTIFGPVAFSVGTAMGVLRVVILDKDCYFNIVPVDHVINLSLAMAWDVANTKITKNKDQFPICNSVVTPEQPITYGEYNKKGFVQFSKWQSMEVLWPAMLLMVTSMTQYKILAFFLHTIPAFFVDIGLRLMGKKPIAQKIYKKIDKGILTYKHFLLTNYEFTNEATQRLWKNLGQKDKEIFYFSAKDLDYDQYLNDIGKGARIYLLKDPIETLPKARRRAVMLRIANYTLLTVIAYLLYKLILLICYCVSLMF